MEIRTTTRPPVTVYVAESLAHSIAMDCVSIILLIVAMIVSVRIEAGLFWNIIIAGMTLMLARHLLALVKIGRSTLICANSVEELLAATQAIAKVQYGKELNFVGTSTKATSVRQDNPWGFAPPEQ